MWAVLAWLDPKELIGLPFALLILLLLLLHAPTIPPGSATMALVGFAIIAALWVLGLALTITRPARRWLRASPQRWEAVRFARDLAAMGLCFSVYGSLQWAVPLLNDQRFDSQLAAIDRLLFGGWDPALIFDPVVSPALTLFFSALYFLHFPLFFATPTLLFVQQRSRQRAEVTLGLMLAMYLGYVGYFLVPAFGPLYGLADRYVHDLTDNLFRDVVHGYGVALGTFPSLHTGIPAVALAFAWRDHRRLRWALLPIALGIWASTLYLRYHYVVDLLAGWALAAVSVWLASELTRRRQRWLRSGEARQTRARIARRALASLTGPIRSLAG